MSVIPGFTPLQTHHCVSGSVRQIYEFHGCPISEARLLGLGAGVGFVYWRAKGAAPFMGGRANTGRAGESGMEILSGRRCGVVVTPHTTANAALAEKTLLALLAANEPVFLQVDMGCLPYFNFGEEYHFGGHAVVAAGYSPETGAVHIADREGVLYPVSLADLARARGSKCPPFTPRHKWYTFDFTGFRAPAPAEVRASIREAADGMFDAPIANLGLRGIRTARQRVLAWPKEMDAEALQRACFNVYIMIDAAGGTGGGLFRYLYGQYLLEAAALTGDARYVEVAAAFQRAGDLWQTAAGRFQQAAQLPNPAPALDEASAPLVELAALEEDAWGQLRRFSQEPEQ